MSRYIVKLPHAERPYVEWCSIVDAPRTRGITHFELEEHIKEEYGNEGLREMPARMARVEEHGTSGYDGETAENSIEANRAGAGETCLTMEQLVDFYCERQCVGDKPKGTSR